MTLALRLLRDGPVSDAHNLLLLTSCALRTSDVTRSREAGGGLGASFVIG
ncbi:hypothetical protein [Streptomyces sp. NPDC093568]